MKYKARLFTLHNKSRYCGKTETIMT